MVAETLKEENICESNCFFYLFQCYWSALKKIPNRPVVLEEMDRSRHTPKPKARQNARQTCTSGARLALCWFTASVISLYLTSINHFPQVLTKGIFELGNRCSILLSYGRLLTNDFKHLEYCYFAQYCSILYSVVKPQVTSVLLLY
jgi:hypothetical protein